MTFTFPTVKASQIDRLELWLRSVLWDSVLPNPEASSTTNHSTTFSESSGNLFSVHRLKGRVVLDTGEVKMIQGVREVFEITSARTRSNTSGADGEADPPELPESKIVIIGKDVAGKSWFDSLRTYITEQ